MTPPMNEINRLKKLLSEARPFLHYTGAECRCDRCSLVRSIDAAIAEPVSENLPTVREACRRRMPLDGTDAQALEHAVTITERERDEARAALKRIGKVLSDNGCDCECDHYWEDHEETCERCLACRVEMAMGMVPV